MTSVKLCLAQTLTHPETSVQLDQLHRKYGFGDSRLLKVRSYLHFLKESSPEAIWSLDKAIHEDKLCETWNILDNAYTYRLCITSYKATQSPICCVKNPDTPKAVKSLINHIRSTINDVNKEAVTRLFNTVFNSHSSDCVYAIDIDEHEWSMMMHDNRNHTQLVLEVFKSR